MQTDKIDDNYYRVTKDTEDKNQFNLRIDFNESSSSQWFGRWSWTDESSINPGLPLSGTTLLSNASQYMINNTRVFSPTTVNEFRFGINTMYNEVGQELGGVRNVVEELGLPIPSDNPASWGIPAIRGLVGGYSSFGNGANGPFVIDDIILQVADNFKG